MGRGGIRPSLSLSPISGLLTENAAVQELRLLSSFTRPSASAVVHDGGINCPIRFVSRPFPLAHFIADHSMPTCKIFKICRLVPWSFPANKRTKRETRRFRAFRAGCCTLLRSTSSPKPSRRRTCAALSPLSFFLPPLRS